MAVLVEANSVIVRRDSIDRKFIGGWDAYLKTVPNQTMCTDGEVVRVGFLSTDGVGEYLDELVARGLDFVEDEFAIDIVVCDQLRGPTTKCKWIEFGQLPFEGDGKVSAAWLFEGPRKGYGFHFKGKSISMAFPSGWQYKESLSFSHQFVDDNDDTVNLIRH